MTKESKRFSRTWNASKKVNKQRKYRFNAPLHIKHSFMHVHLSDDLKKKYNKRNTGVRTGDKVKIMTGAFKKHEGKVERVDRTKERVYISGVERTKRDGTKMKIGIHPSNLIITDLVESDKNRKKILSRGTQNDGKKAS